MARLKFGAFLAPHHPIGEHPMLQFRRDLDLVEQLDALGYDEFWCGEHHSSGWETIASPEMFLAAAGERTKRIKLGTGVVSLPYHHPFNVAQRMVQLDHMTGGRAIFASGSPFAPVTLNGVTHTPGQGNNSYIFPGVGLGAIACGATRITDEMFLAAADTLAAQVTPADLDQGSLFPPLTNIREVSARIAVAVAEVAYRRGLAATPRATDLRAQVQAHVFDPHYRACI